MNSDALVAWVAAHGLSLVIGVVVLVVVYRYAKPMIHKVVLGILRAQQATLDSGGVPAEELRKRAATLEDLLAKLIRFAVFGLLIVLILSVFDLWSFLAGIGLIAAALTIAGQGIVLDFLMGVLILMEAQYFNGDWISVSGLNGNVEGEVEEVGLRRTVLRDSAGVVHSVSNGLIRVSSNLTRVFAVASVEVRVLRTQDLDRAIDIVNRVGQEMADDEGWKERVLEAPHFTSVADLSVDGAVVRVRGRVRPTERWTAASELRRRLAAAFTSAGIGTARWDTERPEGPASGLASDGAEATEAPM